MRSTVCAFFLLVALQATAVVEVAAQPYRYYCPEKNGYILANEVGGILNQGDTSERKGGRSLSDLAHVTGFDCSAKEYLCVRLSRNDPHRSLTLISPREIAIGNTYIFGHYTILAQVALVEDYSRAARLIIHDNQRVNATPLVIVVAERRGIIFIRHVDLLDFSIGSQGGTCTLDSRIGYFGDVKVRPPKELNVQ
jgi:hypothetical protein